MSAIRAGPGRLHAAWRDRAGALRRRPSNVLQFCNSRNNGVARYRAPADVDVLDKVRSLDIMPRQTQAVNSVQTNTGQRSRAAVFEGTEISDVRECASATGRERQRL